MATMKSSVVSWKFVEEFRPVTTLERRVAAQHQRAAAAVELVEPVPGPLERVHPGATGGQSRRRPTEVVALDEIDIAAQRRVGALGRLDALHQHQAATF